MMMHNARFTIAGSALVLLLLVDSGGAHAAAAHATGASSGHGQPRALALPQQYSAQLTAHLAFGAETEEQGTAHVDAPAGSFRVQYAGTAPPPSKAKNWNVGLQLLRQGR